MADRWEWRRNFLWRQGGDFVLYYTVNDDGLHGTDADKNLIAAAPDLFDVAEAMLEIIDDQLGGDFPDTVRAAKAAIAKAIGQ